MQGVQSLEHDLGLVLVHPREREPQMDHDPFAHPQSREAITDQHGGGDALFVSLNLDEHMLLDRIDRCQDSPGHSQTHIEPRFDRRSVLENELAGVLVLGVGQRRQGRFRRKA